MADTPEKQQEKKILAKLHELGGGLTKEDDLVFEGSRFVLPENMSVKGAIDFLRRYQEQQEEVTAFDRTFKYRPWDGAAALTRALKSLFGTSGIGKAQMSFFGTTPPEQKTINVGVNETITVPWGELEVPMLGGSIFLGGSQDPELGPLFRLVVQAPKKYEAAVQGLFKVVQTELEERSIYKGRAIDGQDMPDFVDLEGVDRDKVVYAEQVARDLEANVWSVLRHSEELTALDIPLKRATLLEGPYGTGKTLAAFITAQEAVANGWTFVYCRPGKDNLDRVMQTARIYQPSVVFYEDVDTIADGGEGERDEIARLLDLFDGIQAKGTQLMAVMTTNHVERIHKGMVRPGRLDAVIHVGKLDDPGVKALIEASVPDDQLAGDVDYDVVAEAMNGFLPAFVKESIDRAVRYAVARTGSRQFRLDTEDFVLAANGLRPQLELMEGASEGEPIPTLDRALRKVLRDGVDGVSVLGTMGGNYDIDAHLDKEDRR